MICHLAEEGITECWEIAGMASTQELCITNISEPAGLVQPADIPKMGRTYVFWLACKQFMENSLKRSAKQAASQGAVPEHFTNEDYTIDGDTRMKAEITFGKRHAFKIEAHLQPHDSILGMIKHDLESRDLRVIPLNQVWLKSEVKKTAQKKQKISDELAIIVGNEDENTPGGVFDRFQRLFALLNGYCIIGCLDEFTLLDPEDERTAAEKAADPRYVPFLEFGTALAYSNFFMRMTMEDVSGTKSRPTLDAVVDAEFRTREHAFRKVRNAHLKGKIISISQALEEAIVECSGHWRFTTGQSRDEAIKAKRELNRKSQIKANPTGNGNGNGNGKNRQPKGKGKGLSGAALEDIIDKKNWSSANGVWRYTSPAGISSITNSNKKERDA